MGSFGTETLSHTPNITDRGKASFKVQLRRLSEVSLRVPQLSELPLFQCRWYQANQYLLAIVIKSEQCCATLNLGLDHEWRCYFGETTRVKEVAKGSVKQRPHLNDAGRSFSTKD